MTWNQWVKTALKGPRADPWSTWLAVWAIGTAVLFVMDSLMPDTWFDPHTPIDSGIPKTIVITDALFYLTGGVLVLTGLVSSRLAQNARRPINLEQVGWIIITTAATANLLIVVFASPRWVLTMSWTAAVILGGIGRYLQLLAIERRAETVANVLAQVAENNQRLEQHETGVGAGEC